MSSSILEIFKHEDIIKFIEDLTELIKSLNQELKSETNAITDFEQIKSNLTIWKDKSSSEIRKIYIDNLKTIKEGMPKPQYEEFIRIVSDELQNDKDFMDRFKKLGENIIDTKEYIKSKILDEITIYN